jgi:DNA gyrase/topoisomerase IV subunit B
MQTMGSNSYNILLNNKITNVEKALGRYNEKQDPLRLQYKRVVVVTLSPLINPA